MSRPYGCRPQYRTGVLPMHVSCLETETSHKERGQGCIVAGKTRFGENFLTPGSVCDETWYTTHGFEIYSRKPCP